MIGRVDPAQVDRLLPALAYRGQRADAEVRRGMLVAGQLLSQVGIDLVRSATDRLGASEEHAQQA